MNQDLRETPRKKPERLVYVEFGSENGGMIRDLSENGMGFRSVGPLRTNEKIPFSFLFEGGEALRGEAHVVWTDGDGRSGGLLFVNISDEARNKLRAWCVREMHQPGAQPARREANSTASTFEELRKELRSQISPVAAGTSIAVDEIPAIREKTRPAPPVAAVAHVREDAASKSAGIEAGQTIPPPAPSHPVESNKRTPAPDPPVPVIAPVSFDRDVNRGLKSRFPFQGSLTETRWIENVTISWVIVAMLVLTLAAAGFVFHNEVGQAFIWLGAKIAGSDQPAPVVQHPAVQQPAPSTSDASSGQAENRAAQNPSPGTAAPRANVPPTSVPPATATGKTGISPEKQKNQTTPPALPPSSASDSKGPATTREGAAPTYDQALDSGVGPDNPLNASPTSASAGDDENGQNALRQAMRILRSDRRSTDIAETVRLLWIAVEHGSSEAEVVLAELYRTGEGVAQSCDQTHILLTAAARKGNSEAKSRLIEIAHTGCP